MTQDREPPEAANLLTDLDADGNGLYDAVERKALLSMLQRNYRGLQATYDANNDGRVTVAEQTRGRHPLSVRIPERLLESPDKIPWGLDIFPEWIMTAYFQEDVAEGAVGEHPSRGTVERLAAQDMQELQPRKPASGRGIEFAANSKQHFSMPGHRDARWNYRWCIFTFRIDAESGPGKTTVLLDLNHGNESNKSSPKIWFDKEAGLCIQYVGRNKGGLDKRLMTTRHVAADGSTWNVVVCGIRYGQMFASVNGIRLTAERPQPPRFCGGWPRGTTSYIGDRRNGSMSWAYDALVFGQTEPSEAMVRKMTGWAAHRLGFQDNLPAGHPYKERRPIVDEQDFPRRYVHDDDAWTAWGQSLTKAATRVNTGGPRVEPQGFERVFYDDFRAYRVTPSTSGEGDLWMAPGFNPAVGVDAPLVTPGREPNTYPYDAANNWQILALVKQGKRWRGSAFYSVNDLGHGYTWRGPKIFRIRCMFPDIPQAELAGGLFPAFWSYSTEWLFWRTTNRIECDWFEFDGQNGHWYNGLSSHYHYSHLKHNIFARKPGGYKRYKVFSGELTEDDSNIPGGLFFWDGRFHTWEFVIGEKMTYVNVTIPRENGGERWVEICRCPTPPTYLQRLDLQLDYALKARHGTPDGERQDFVVDWIEVLQKTSAVETIPAVFTARPSLSGGTTVGGTVTCHPNVADITDIRYYWFADGYPLTYGPDSTCTVTATEAGTEIRCMVKAVGALDMPEAWSDTVRVRASGGH